jgi:hypothetical protein
MAEKLSFPEQAFDAVVSQFGSMFFEDRRAALTRCGGSCGPAVAVWDALDRTPGCAAIAALLQRLFGDRVADALRAPFALGDPEALRAVLQDYPELAVHRTRNCRGKSAINRCEWLRQSE